MDLVEILRGRRQAAHLGPVQLPAPPKVCVPGREKGKKKPVLYLKTEKRVIAFLFSFFFFFFVTYVSLEPLVKEVRLPALRPQRTTEVAVASSVVHITAMTDGGAISDRCTFGARDR